MHPRLWPVLALAALCLSGFASAAPADHFLIVPGRSIGQTALGPDGAAELKRLPAPTAGDNGMMQTHNVWVLHHAGRTDTLYVHTVANAALGNAPVKPAGGVTIDVIRITSPQFHTQHGISTRSTLAQVRRRFPQALPNRFHPQVYGDAKRGISFEFAPPLSPASRCLAVTVYPPFSSPHAGAAVTQSNIHALLHGGAD